MTRQGPEARSSVVAVVAGVWKGLESLQPRGMCWLRPALPSRALGTCSCGQGQREAVETLKRQVRIHWKACVIFVS